MVADREQILNEILEHTRDCDYNRSQHFVEHQHYSRLSRLLNLVQITSLLFLVIFCSVLAPEMEMENPFLEYIIPIILSIIATSAELIDYFCNYSDLAQQHWLAAQAYARLYRQCQFFPSHYGINCDENIMREAALNICNELFDLNLMSPDLSERSYKKVKYLNDKKYPLESIVFLERKDHLKDFANCIKDKFNGVKIEIVSFGSYPNKNHHGDIDIAIVVHSEDIDENELLEKTIALEQSFRNKKQIVDLTLLTKKHINNPLQIPFIMNVKKGELLYSSFGVSSSIFSYDFDIADFKRGLDECFKNVTIAYGESDSNNYINKAFYYVQNAIRYILLNRDISWESESEMVMCFENILSSNIEFSTIMSLYLTLKKYKNNENSIGNEDDSFEVTKNKTYETIVDVNKIIAAE
jgi:predicted nucleotidyltransferase